MPDAICCAMCNIWDCVSSTGLVFWPSDIRTASGPAIPEELVEVTMFHVLKHHDEGVALHADSVESDNVFMLKVCQ
ncbi:hypothetical protein F7725_012931 [Dissostichus mawsoni]|uniref:Uncharacterized protein n=1 Tax=Dissostichus mawsoni TaxID=36200 RepID=A0A7J5YR24_DISMA|nr:hypothetical protein F7725_012931 [Dissostichus mawsoni]